MSLKFAKMHGLGNDFVVVDCIDTDISHEIHARANALCDRHRGVGADGVICVLSGPSETDYRMRIFNADGSEAEMCGNGVRCFAEYLRIIGRFADNTGKLTVDTLAGLIEVEFIRVDNAGGHYMVNMGCPRLTPNDVPVIPVDLSDENFIMREISVLDRTFKVTAVSMGNPHAVVYTDELSDELVHVYGQAIQKSSYFPKGVNVEFVKILSPDEVRLRVYERGCGETHACGTGACAAVVVGIINEMHNHDITVHLMGGDLQISWDGDIRHPVYKSGPAKIIFEGVVPN